jgi:signal transduction histidine kinase
VESEAEKQGVMLRKNLHPVPSVRIDRGQLRQVFFNLVQNALDSMPHGGELRISSYRKGDTIRVQVSDTGTGVSSEIRDKIFTPFFTTKTGGSGLGLSVTRLVVELHGGRLRIASEENRGTSVSVLLPVRRR